MVPNKEQCEAYDSDVKALVEIVFHEIKSKLEFESNI